MVLTSPGPPAAPDRLAGEREALASQLDFHRATLPRKLAGLGEQVDMRESLDGTTGDWRPRFVARGFVCLDWQPCSGSRLS